MSFLIQFNETEKKILSTYRITFLNNERNYVFDAIGESFILDSGRPTFFSCGPFTWKGSTWKDLLLNFTNWFIGEVTFDSEDMVMIMFESNGKSMFSKTMETNHYGPLENGLYINGNPTSGNLVWRKILQLIQILNADFLKETQIYIHYPSAVEPTEVIKIIWKKEISLYSIYLSKLGYDSDYINNNIQFVKYINSIYRKIRPNYIFFMVDRVSDLLNATSLIKKALTPNESKKLLPVLNNITKFKRLLKYPDENFSIK